MSNNIKPSKYPVNPDEQADLLDQAVNAGRAGKQDALVSGTNIKTVNGNSLLGSGNIVVSSSSSNPRTISNINGNNLLGTSIQISATVTINSNTLVANNSLYIRSLITKTAGSTTSTARLYINTNNTLTGATLIGTSAQMNSTTYIQRFERNFFFDGSNLFCYNPANGIATDLTVATITLVPFNAASTYYLIFTVQNSSTTPDNMGFKRVIVQIYD